MFTVYKLFTISSLGAIHNWTGRTRLFAQGEVFKHELTEKMFGTGQNRSVKRGVRLSRVFVRRGSTVYEKKVSHEL